jgi:hypothetical protein
MGTGQKHRVPCIPGLRYRGARAVCLASPRATAPGLPLVSQVCLVAHQHDDHIAAPLCPDVVNPLRGLLEGVQIWRQKVGIKWSEGGPSEEDQEQDRQTMASRTWEGQKHCPHILARLGPSRGTGSLPAALESPCSAIL